MNSLYKVLLLCLVALAYADDKKDAINQLVDAVLGNILNMEEINPLTFHQDYDRDFDEQIGLLRLFGHLKVSKGQLYGLNHLKRTGDSILTTDNGVMTVELSLKTVGEVMLDADISGRFGLVSFSDIAIQAHIDEIQFHTKLELGSDSHLHLKKFSIEDIDHVHLRLKDSGQHPLIDRIVDDITEALVILFNEQIEDVAEQVVKPILVNELKYIHI